MKNTLAVIGIVLLGLLLVGGAGFLFLRGRKSEAPATPTSEPEGVLIETTLEERPYVSLIPRADGKEFTLELSRIESAETVEYELVYKAGEFSRGAVGSVKLKGEDELSRKVLLGTCSRNVCRYDEGVEEGTLTLRFRSSEGTRKFVSDFHLQQGDEELTSLDGNFKLEGRFSSGAYYITMSTIGLPGEIEGEVLAGPYGVFSSASKVVKDGKVEVALDKEIASPVLYAWSGSAWEEVKGIEIEEQELTAPVDQLATFVVATGKATLE